MFGPPNEQRRPIDDHFVTGDALTDGAIAAVLSRCGGVLPVERLQPEFVHRVAAREFIEQYRRSNRTVTPDPRTPRPIPPEERPWQSEGLTGLGFEVRIQQRDEIGLIGAPMTSDTGAWVCEARADDDIGEAGTIALQMSRGDRAFPTASQRRAGGGGWASDGPGDNVGLALAMLSACADVPARIAIKHSHAAAFVRTLRSAAIQRPAPVTLALLEDAPSQWARDHTLAMTSSFGGTAAVFPARSTRADLPGEEAPEDSAAARALCVGVPTRTSELTFQGGNIVVCTDPKPPMNEQGQGEGSRRVALIGEAEIARNSSAFADSEACAAAFQREFGVGRVIVLPNASFHIDFDLFAPTCGVVFVADEFTASLMLVREAVTRLAASRLMDRRAESAVRTALGRMKFEDTAALLWGWLSSHRTASGAIGSVVPAALGDVRSASSRGEHEGAALLQGLADTHRLLAAIDRLAARSDESWIDRLGEPHRTYLRALKSLDQARVRVSSALSAEGWKVVAVPSAPDADRGVSALNAVSIGGRLHVPGVSGIGTTVVESAAAAMRRAIASNGRGKGVSAAPATAPISIQSDESQFRQGSVRCSVVVLGKS